MAIQKTEAIILKTIPLRSSSLIVTFFTKNFGKVRGVVKGVREERQNRSSLYELFTRVEIVFYEKMRTDLHLISEASFVDTYESIRTRLEPLTYASYFTELVDETTEVHDPHPELFDLLDFSFRYLSSLPGERLSRLFEIKLLGEIGWLPYLDGCVVCENTSIEKGFFSARQGALLCEQCVKNFPDARPLGREALAIMRYYSKHDLEESLRFNVSKTSEDELAGFMNRFFMERLSKPFKSRQFLEKIKPVIRL